MLGEAIGSNLLAILGKVWWVSQQTFPTAAEHVTGLECLYWLEHGKLKFMIASAQLGECEDVLTISVLFGMLSIILSQRFIVV